MQARVQGAPTDGATSIDAAGAASGEAGASSFGASCWFKLTFEKFQVPPSELLGNISQKQLSVD